MVGVRLRAGLGRSEVTRRAIRLEADLSGCYELPEDQRPVCVGISHGVLTRVRQHTLGASHFDASLAYLIALPPEFCSGPEARAEVSD